MIFDFTGATGPKDKPPIVQGKATAKAKYACGCVLKNNNEVDFPALCKTHKAILKTVIETTHYIANPEAQEPTAEG